ncbi:tubulin-like doman-containing protein [Corynebacterium variabile]|uniref:tubulin-like doman-containing protein n=1 Tax=Corynebacterium variabile TaxID=1727 RepID=UPI0028AFAC5C|nr:tubulin-like doman-containing protein [Corynebacterium variabile]
MKKFLVVGCGGSGAKTQAYMIDQLKAHLRAFDPTLTSLPKAWQFVSIDVPVSPEKGPDGLGNVQDNGGRYVGIGSKQQYKTFDSGLSMNLGSKGVLGEVATWAPRHPEAISTPVSDGAGQFRGLGRMLTLQSIPRIREELKAAMDILEESSTISELNDLNYRITGHQTSAVDSSPVILVVSSMAGGAGASMFLDVCRILSTLPNAKPEHTGVFMLTPEVFENLPADAMVGAWPNALAMFGEAVATQTGAATDSDIELFRALGVNAEGSSNTFARLFPIGGRMGATGARFGDGNPNTVYRGLGRALAALMTSEKSADSFVQYSLGNTGATAANRDYLGWADASLIPWGDMPWGSMGYAQLSMGRDRYAEYSAQRLARTAFDRILRGHMDPLSTDTGEEQLQKRLNERYPRILDKIWVGQNILYSEPNQATTAQWIGGVFSNFAGPAAQQSSQWLRQRLPASDGMKASDWGSLVRSRLTDQAAANEIHRQLDDAAYGAVHAFADQFCDQVIGTCEEYLSTTGLPFVEKVIDRLSEDIRQRLVGPMEMLLRDARGRSPAVVTPPIDQMLAPLTGNGAVTGSGQILDNIAAQYRSQFNEYFTIRVADYLSRVLEDFLNNALSRLARELTDAHADLEHADRKKSVNINLADVATDDPVAWPRDRDEMISDRFRGSANEILISDVDHFPADYVTHIVQDVRVADPEVFDERDASLSAAQSVIRGQWDTNGAEKTPQDTLAVAASSRAGGNRAGWVSRHLVASRGTGEERESRPGSFKARIRPAQLLQRARLWIQRPDYHFSKFISTDLRSYMTQDEATNDATFAARIARLRSAFGSALDQARPLAAVDSPMVSLVHGQETEFHYNFSEIPFKANSAVEQLQAVLNQNTALDPSTRDAMEGALSDGSKVRHIDVFGSYPNYSPVVFSSLFPHIVKDWNSRTNHDGYWSLRRSRPITATVPLSDAERQAMVAGWLIGAVTGRIHIQGDGTPQARAHIYDDAAHQWVDFPHPLLTPPQAMKAKIDWMPAVIESVLLAYAQVQDKDGHGGLAGSLRPYRLLRELYDTHSQSPTSGANDHPAVTRLAGFLTDGERPDQATLGTGIQDRYDLFLAQLNHAAKNADMFLPGGGGLPGAQVQVKPWATVTDRGHASAMPLYRDFAPDVRDMTRALKTHLDAAKQRAENPGLSAGPATAPADPFSAPTGQSSQSGPALPDFGGDLF